MQWAEVSIQTTHEATDVVAEIYHELGASGVVIEDPELLNNYIDAGQWDFSGIERAEDTSIVTFFCRASQTSITDVSIEGDKFIHLSQLVLIIEISLVEDEEDRNSISFCACQKAINESCACFRMCNRDDKSRHVDICSYDVALLREVGGLANDVVATVLDVLNQSSLPVRTWGNSHHVAYSNRIRAPDAL